MFTNSDIKTSNREKFQAGNFLVRQLIDTYFVKLETQLQAIEFESLLDAGCGEGETFARLRHLLPAGSEGFDINSECVAFCKKRLPGFSFSQQNIYYLPWSDASFDAVLCLEVLEHLSRPDDALRELLRVARRSIILSVPHEPWFQLGNLLRGKYLSTWGNHPEHIHHWNLNTFRQFLAPHIRVVEIKSAFPWMIAHCSIAENSE